MRAHRSSPRVWSVLFVLAAPSLVLTPLASAETPKTPTAPDAGDRFDPENVTGISPFMETIAKGTALWRANDTTAAIDTYKKAVQQRPKNVLGHCMLAEAYLASGNLGEADAVIGGALEVSSAKDLSLHGRVLFLRAEILERQKKTEEAKAAWQAYTEHASHAGAAGVFPQTAAERIKALQRVLDLEKSYAPVRERIAAEKSRKADAGKSAPKK